MREQSLMNVFYYVFILRTEVAFDCLKILESRFKNSPDLYKVQLEHLVSFKQFMALAQYFDSVAPVIG